MPASYGNVHELAASVRFSEKAYGRALDLADLAPHREDWLRYVDRFLAALGAVLIVAGIAAFFAWNWADLHRSWKLGLIQAALVGAVALTWRLGLDTTGGRAALGAGAFLIGVLFAVFGQVYQTGADPYGLFLVWAALVLPLALAGRQAGLWLLLQVLLNLTVILYWTQVLHPPQGWWTLSQLLGPLVWLGSAIIDWRLAGLLFALNAAAVALWEIVNGHGGGRLFPRLVGLMAFYTVLAPTLIMIFAASADERTNLSAVSPATFAAAAGASLWYYQYRKLDLFMLTMVMFGGVLVVMALAIEYVFADVGSLLLLALLLIGLVAGAAAWLRAIARRRVAAA